MIAAWRTLIARRSLSCRMRRGLYVAQRLREGNAGEQGFGVTAQGGRDPIGLVSYNTRRTARRKRATPVMTSTPSRAPRWELFLLSFLALYYELVAIRWLAPRARGF